MRIAVLSAARSIHTVRWVNALAARGHSVELYSLGAHRTDYDRFDSGVGVHYLPGSGAAGYFFGARRLRAMLTQFDPDVLSAHYATGYGTLARRSGIRPLLLSVWGADVYEFPEKNAFSKRLVQLNLGAADAIASTSCVMAERVRELGGQDKKIYITPFGVDTGIFSPAQAPHAGPLTIGTVKALEPKYGIDYLLRAFSLLHKRLTREGRLPEGGLRLVIYGAGSEEKALRGLGDELGITGITQFRGRIPYSQVPDALREMDIFCALSVEDSESFGVSAVEAMACGLPVVTSDADGFREVMKDGATGFIVPKRDQVTAANKLRELCADPELRRLMGGAGRERVKSLYEWDRCVDAMEQALRRTAAGTGGGERA
jgi:glycosyltransferase involved in cell wall biosynthesis